MISKNNSCLERLMCVKPISFIWNAQLLLLYEILFSASSLVIIYSFLTIESLLKDRIFIQYLIIFTFLFAIRGNLPSSARFFNPNIFLQNLVCNISISYDLWCSQISDQQLYTELTRVSNDLHCSDILTCICVYKQIA